MKVGVRARGGKGPDCEEQRRYASQCIYLEAEDAVHQIDAVLDILSDKPHAMSDEGRDSIQF